MKNRNTYWRYKIQEILYIGQWHLSPLHSRHLGTSHSSLSISSIVQNTLHSPLLELPSAALSYFPEFHWWFEIFSFSKEILVLRKARSLRAPNLGCREAESAGWFDVLPKNCTRHNERAGALSWWTCQSLTASSPKAFWITRIVSVEECLDLTQNLMKIYCSTCSVTLNVAVTKYTCSLNSVYCPHWLV